MDREKLKIKELLNKLRILIVICLSILINNNFCLAESLVIIPDAYGDITESQNIYTKSAYIMSNNITNKISEKRKFNCVEISTIPSNVINFDEKNLLRDSLLKYRKSNIIDYPTLKVIAKKLKATKILLITSNIDMQSKFLESTVWNYINIGGMETVNPKYILNTHFTLIDIKNQKIILDKIIAKDIKSEKFDIINQNIGTNYGDITSLDQEIRTIANNIVPIIESKVLNIPIPAENLKQSKKQKLKLKIQEYLKLEEDL